MFKKTSYFLFPLLLSGLVSCNILAPFNASVSNYDIEQQYQAVSALLTQTARVVSTGTATPVAIQAPIHTSTVEMVPTRKATEGANPTNVLPPTSQPVALKSKTALSASGTAPAVPCDFVQPGRPIDISVPDDTLFQPGEYFSKTWRLVNAGNCRWTGDYGVVWFSGSDLGLNRDLPLTSEVKPGAFIDVTVDMVAPQAPGTYQSNWKLRNSHGQLFGIGPNGDAPFWVRIVVAPVDSPTPTTAIPTPTQTPEIFASGTLSMLPGDGVDLDNGLLNQAENDDLVMNVSAAGQVLLSPENGAQIARMAQTMPGWADCDLAETGLAPVDLAQTQPGSYICYHTAKGLPGFATITVVDPQKYQFNLEFTTWAVP